MGESLLFVPAIGGTKMYTKCTKDDDFVWIKSGTANLHRGVVYGRL